MQFVSRIIILLGGLFLVTSGWGLEASVSGVAVICHPGTNISDTEVSEIYKGVKRFSESQKLFPIDNAEVQDEFIRNLLELDIGSYHSIWEKLAFQDGVVPPKRVSNDREVLEFVEKHPGAIGYIHTFAGGEWKAKVKTVKEFQ